MDLPLLPPSEHPQPQGSWLTQGLLRGLVPSPPADPGSDGNSSEAGEVARATWCLEDPPCLECLSASGAAAELQDPPLGDQLVTRFRGSLRFSLQRLWPQVH